MAMIADTHHRNLRDTIAAPFQAVVSFLTLLAEANPRLAAVERLNRLSDEDLAARGTSREDEIRRIFGIRASI
ncbi:DUF1127 domain-containing protein [Rubellimicrobium roseum]|uniref:DUF1127 domain-containing protein n=1 Tax=Rubellimicrobium roseum TaxID=687525 RepID=A0A5C4N679_9RHOB|nr:DUF1127 domain-containing protein [Rubellimicrobium roseum]TNC65971.1 DUF1127 domain-containing protein [Rubellimicrobium roseum]